MRILNYLAQQNQKLTVAELIEDIKINQKIVNKTMQSQIEECCKKYAGTYLKIADVKSLAIYHIDELKPAGKNIDYQQLYTIKGKIIRFNYNNIHIENLMFFAPHETINESELEEMEIIPEKKYQDYLNQYYEVKDILRNTVDNG